MTNNIRIFLWLGLLMALWLNYETWRTDYAPPPGITPAVAGSSAAAAAPVLGASVPQAAVPAPATNSATAATPVPAAVAPDAIASATVAPAGAVAGVVRVVTDVLDVDITLQGGELSRADLLKYPRVKGGEQAIRLFDRSKPEEFYALQSGLAPGPGAAGEFPTHLAVFQSAQTEYRLAPGVSEVRVPLTWVNAEGVQVSKVFVFRAGEYRVDLEYDITNKSSGVWNAASYAQILRDDLQIETSMFNVESYAHKGPAYFDGKKYSKLKIADEDDSTLSKDLQGGWIAGMQHHFVTAVVPNAKSSYHYGLKVSGRQYLMSVVGPVVSVASGDTAKLTEALFMGPKLQGQLASTGPELDRVTDYGWLTLLSRPLFQGIQWVHGVVGNWGWAIIIVTFLLKLAFYPLSEAAGRSMAKMRVLGPRMKNLQETYKDDREKLGRAMMELYQKEKINPLAGCLPMLIQMPVFLAFYWVLLESVEMRQAPWLGWIQDLSDKDPFFVLPVINAFAMFGQFKLNPAPPDPMQAKIFAFMPFVVSFTFIFFPSGLVLYWVTSTLLSILQQWNINRRIGEPGKPKAANA